MNTPQEGDERSLEGNGERVHNEFAQSSSKSEVGHG